MRPTDQLTPQEVSQRSGVAVSALHFYESRGLISATRTSGNQRRYRREVLRRLAFVQFSQRLGIPLAEVGAALETLPSDRTPTKRDWARLTARWREDLDQRIERLQRLRDDLDGCIGCGCLSLRSCAVYNHDDELAGLGSGPHRGLV
ncbi:redox-sensitive transcriptional activator SoxR [Aeromicrobium sp. 50.2.37]|uniref:redox-sensitive transcriptional activator SoxR n=1 Tax=Aeromicrobium sp. 50.2.37 TaxID=2969305 RepID=UPI00214F8C63|nr:redox-sensitive transcriptional activator SoxR [Aeromicrobium sp. 50.2.37]MCR4514340.1 redox-sensitive transcriptional activator SoxR [Aeromicrobium sp. 50.2.37]